MAIAFADHADLCADCMLFHVPPRCGHDSRRPCADCGRPVGYRFTADDGGPGGRPDQCARCFWTPERLRA